jgi:preprotein translocase subunit SecB
MSEQQAPQQQFAVQRLYIKDLSFEAPMGAEVFAKQWKPQMQVELNSTANEGPDGLKEVVLSVTITAKLEDKVAVLIEVQQAGLFTIKGIEGEQLKQILGIMCPNLLFPYAREAIDNLAMKGGFPALGLQPVNFEALYAQAQQKAQQPAAATH